jgi:hypothetical protein
MQIPQGGHASRLEDAIATLRECVHLSEREPRPDTHTLVEVRNLETPEATSALGTYLTGIVAGLVAVDRRITEQYLVTDDGDQQLRIEVEQIIGASNQLTGNFRDTRRNPWIAECLAHVFLMLAGEDPGVCVPGHIWAMTVPHDKVTQQGLDLVAVYEEEDGPSLCIGESKASEQWAADHLNDSIRLFRDVDDRKRDFQIRVTLINSLGAHIPEAVREAVPGMFWRDRRLYLPVIGHADNSDFNASSARPQTFGALTVPLERRRCVSVALADFHHFFDDVAIAMRDAVDAFA